VDIIVLPQMFLFEILYPLMAVQYASMSLLSLALVRKLNSECESVVRGAKP